MADSIEPAHISRMRTELAELSKKIDGLAQYLAKPEHLENLTRQQVMLLNVQQDTMRVYERILNHRIEIDHAIWERDNAVEPNEPVVGATTENTDAVTGES